MAETQPQKCSTIITQIPQLRPKLSQANTFSATIIQSLTRIPKFLTDSKSVTTRISQSHSPRQSVRETQPKNCTRMITQILQLRPKLSQANAFSTTIIQSLTRIPKFLTGSKSITTRINQIPRPPPKVSRSPISSLPGCASHSHSNYFLTTHIFTHPNRFTAAITQIPRLHPKFCRRPLHTAPPVMKSFTTCPSQSSSQSPRA